MSVKDQIAAAPSYLLDPVNGIAWSLVHWIAGDQTNTETVDAQVFWDEDQLVRSGQSSETSDRSGRKVLHSVQLDLAIAVKIFPDKCKFMLPGGQIATAVKIVAIDVEAGMQTIECQYADGISTKAHPAPAVREDHDAIALSRRDRAAVAEHRRRDVPDRFVSHVPELCGRALGRRRAGEHLLVRGPRRARRDRADRPASRDRAPAAGRRGSAPHVRPVPRRPGQLAPGGALEISFELIPPSGIAGDDRLEARWFCNVIGAITQEMTDSSGGSDGTNSYANIGRMEVVLGPGQCRASEEVETFWAVVFCVEWPGGRK